MKQRSPITTHVLDLHLGKPAERIEVTLERMESEGRWKRVGHSFTNADGRIDDLMTPGSKAKLGLYQMVFQTKPYFEEQETPTFYPGVVIVFEITDPAQHYHVPLLLNAHGYSTYRGS